MAAVWRLRAAPALLRAAEDSRTSLLPEADDFYSRAALQSEDEARGAGKPPSDRSLDS